MTNEAINYDDFCDRAGPLAPAWVDALEEEAIAALLARAWEACAWVETLTDARIVRALEEARR
jgi:hypothetical protein